MSGVGCQDDGGVRFWNFRRDAMATKDFLDAEDLEVYKKLCRLHIEVCDLSHECPQGEKYESLT